jgi:hypothetical protein
MQNRLPSFRACAARALFVVAALAVSAAQAKDLDPQTREYVIASCSGDAYRLCPQSLGSAQDAVSCMKSKRRELGQTCRVAYEKAARILSR